MQRSKAGHAEAFCHNEAAVVCVPWINVYIQARTGSTENASKNFVVVVVDRWLWCNCISNQLQQSILSWWQWICRDIAVMKQLIVVIEENVCLELGFCNQVRFDIYN
jgi:hypothetical protein